MSGQPDDKDGQSQPEQKPAGVTIPGAESQSPSATIPGTEQKPAVTIPGTEQSPAISLTDPANKLSSAIGLDNPGLDSGLSQPATPLASAVTDGDKSGEGDGQTKVKDHEDPLKLKPVGDDKSFSDLSLKGGVKATGSMLSTAANPLEDNNISRAGQHMLKQAEPLLDQLKPELTPGAEKVMDMVKKAAEKFKSLLKPKSTPEPSPGAENKDEKQEAQDQPAAPKSEGSPSAPKMEVIDGDSVSNSLSASDLDAKMDGINPTAASTTPKPSTTSGFDKEKQKAAEQQPFPVPKPEADIAPIDPTKKSGMGM